MSVISRIVLILLIITTSLILTFAGDNEFVGTFETTLMANSEDMDDVIFKNIADPAKLKFEKLPDLTDATMTAARLFHPTQEKNSILSALVEIEDEKPSIYVDINLDGTFSQTELFLMKREKKDNPYLWQATVLIQVNGKLFANYPIYIQYFRSYKYDDMNDSDRLVRQSKEAYAKGFVDIKGKKTLVMYGFNASSQKISTTIGWLGVDSDGDGDVYLDRLSPEAAKADNETVIFRAGQTFVSTKKIDLEKNLIIMREHQANDYKRIELKVGEILPDFQFKDFEGKKRKLSEFRGKHVLIDIWGFWCPPCRRELPYLKAAYAKFQPRGLEILGLNTDTEFTIENINSTMKKNGMNWNHAQLESIVSVIKAYRISSFPTTILIDPQGKIISLSQTDRGQLDLRGKDLLKSLDSLLPL